MFIQNKKCKIFIFLLLFFNLAFLLFSEKWVGQAATYQLIEGSKTASGENYERDGLFAACNGFKLGSKVVIVNAKTGNSVTVTINDRISEESKYFILLTPKASKEIDLEWDTGLVVVNGDFTDINSSERIAINGLVREGEIDLETVKQFPDIKWPDDKDTINDKVVEKHEDITLPKVKEKEIPSEKEKLALLDEDEKNGYIEEKNTKTIEPKPMPSEEQFLTPESKMREYMMSEDIDDSPLPKKDQQFAMLPSEKDKDNLMDYDNEDNFKESKEDVIMPKEENLYAIKPEEKNDIIDYDEETKDTIPQKEEKTKITPNIKTRETPDIKDTSEKKEIEWQGSLLHDKMYVRFFTSFNKKESEKKLVMYQKIFPSLVGLKENNKYILLVGPINNENLDITLKNIRSYGFRDAYILNVK